MCVDVSEERQGSGGIDFGNTTAIDGKFLGPLQRLELRGDARERCQTPGAGQPQCCKGCPSFKDSIWRSTFGALYSLRHCARNGACCERTANYFPFTRPRRLAFAVARRCTGARPLARTCNVAPCICAAARKKDLRAAALEVIPNGENQADVHACAICWFAFNICTAIRFHDSPNAAIFSLLISCNSRRSRALGRAVFILPSR